MRICITGSNGYVGNFLSDHLSKSHEVIGIDLASMPRQKKYKNFTFYKCDIRDETQLTSLLQKHKITHVIHLAYLMDPQHNRDFEDDVDINGSRAIFSAAQKTKSVKQFIHFSSASIYGGFPGNVQGIRETQKPRPRDWVYAQNKVAVEKYYFSKKTSFNLVNLRMCTAVGPSYYKSGGVVSTLAKAPLGLLLNGKDTQLQFIHEDDVKTIIEKILKKPRMNGVYNLAPDSHSTTRELNPNPKKIFFPFPKSVFKAIISFLWYTRIAPVSPTSVNLIAHGIVVSPKKLMKELAYTFKYSTKDAFFDAYNKRKANGTL